MAVLPTGLPAIYPPNHRSLAARIVREGGLLLSEHPRGRRILRRDFVRRNRIQSGLSLAVIVVESKPFGGTMHTVRFAEAQGRAIFCPLPPTGAAKGPRHTAVQTLIDTGRARAFQLSDQTDLISELQSLRSSG